MNPLYQQSVKTSPSIQWAVASAPHNTRSHACWLPVVLHEAPPNECAAHPAAIIWLVASASPRVRIYTAGFSPGSPAPLL